MSNIFNLEKVYAEIRQKHPLLTKSLPTKSLPTKSLPTKSLPTKSTQSVTASFYFYMDFSGTLFNKRIIDNNSTPTSIGNDLIQTSSTSLYENLGEVTVSGNVYTWTVSDYIGKNSSNVTVYNYDVQNDASGNELKDASGNYLYHSFVQSVYRLPTGTIGISYTPKLRHFDDFYGTQNETLEIAPITFGTGEYINKNGTVAIISSAITFLKLVIVFID